VTAKQTRPSRRKGAEKNKLQIYVRRGALRRFDRLKQGTGELPVELKWDRRQADVPATVDGTAEPREERRKEPPFTWGSADFVVVVESYDDE
jgi:hypothetical protein